MTGYAYTPYPRDVSSDVMSPGKKDMTLKDYPEYFLTEENGLSYLSSSSACASPVTERARSPRSFIHRIAHVKADLLVWRC